MYVRTTHCIYVFFYMEKEENKCKTYYFAFDFTWDERINIFYGRDCYLTEREETAHFAN